MKIKVMIIGATGFLGLELVQRLKKLKFEIVMPKRNLINSKISYKSIEDYLKIDSPSCVINCAAMTGLDNCYLNQDDALEVNCFFNIKLASICFEQNIRFLGISTDNVFSCASPFESHSEIDYCEPLTWYGKTKFYGEMKINKSSLLHTLRLPMLFSPFNKSHILCNLIEKAINGEDVKISTDVINTPILTQHAIDWIIGWIQNEYITNPSNISHLYSDQSISIYNLVNSILIKMGFENIIVKAISRDFITHENKPLFGGLQSKFQKPFSLSESIDIFVENY